MNTLGCANDHSLSDLCLLEYEIKGKGRLSDIKLFNIHLWAHLREGTPGRGEIHLMVEGPEEGRGGAQREVSACKSIMPMEELRRSPRLGKVMCSEKPDKT